METNRDYSAAGFLARSLVKVGDGWFKTVRATVFMHEGFDRCPNDGFHNLLMRRYRDVPPDGELYVVLGSLTNPYFSWPVYMVCESRV
jgi:hypothetical protein